MRKTLTLSAVVILAFLSVAAIKFFTDYPNSVPVGSDFFVLQRNQSYINASRDQVKNDWFTSPVFTGNGLIGGNWVIGGVAYGNGGGLTNVPGISGNFFAATNGIGQNPTFYGGGTFNGTYFFQEVDATSFFPTNLFTGKTNYSVLGTDANGQLTLGNTVTNLIVTNLVSITETNNTFVNTNVMILQSNATFTIKKGATLIIETNASLVNSNVAANSIVSTDATHSETNAVIAARLSFSGNSLDLASGIVGAGTYRSVTVDTYGRTTAGSNPTTFSGYGISDSAANLFSALTTYDFSSATNLTYQYKTNAVSNGVLAFNGIGQAYRTNINTDITLGAYTLGPNGTTTYESLVILVTNSDTAVHKITHPSGVFSGGVAAVSWITNGYWNEVVVDHFATLYTNAQVKN